MKTLIGREAEQTILKKVSESPHSEFVAVYGRRRVGKTFLVKQFFDQKFVFYLTGTANVGMTYQLANFYTAYNQYTKVPLSHAPNNWFEAFEALRHLIEQSAAPQKVVFLDELPWLDTPKSNFIAALEYFWNSFGASHAPLKLIVCGSAASWMLNELIKNKGGLHNRVTKRISLKPFTLKETEAFLAAKTVVLERYQIVQIYAVMGGIPYYLNEIDTGQSAAQVIDNVCFSENGLLREEYHQLYHSLFQKAERHTAIVEALSSKAQGLTREELVSKTKIANGGTFTKLLDELEISGFIKKYTPFQKKSKNSLYQLTDPYSLFYHKFIKNSKATGSNSWLNLLDSSTYRAWSGYAFESVCLSHIDSIKKALGISGIYTEESSWRSQTSENGAQIDLLIDRKDGIITICEMKFSNQEYEITKEYAAKLRNKMNTFKTESNTRKTLFLAMVTTFGVKPNQYALGLVQHQLVLDDLFA